MKTFKLWFYVYLLRSTNQTREKKPSLLYCGLSIKVELEGLNFDGKTWLLPTQEKPYTFANLPSSWLHVYVRVMWKRGSWLLSGPKAVTRVCSRRMERGSSAPGPSSTFQVKPRTLEDLPHISVWELIYRLTFQGFHNRTHELQVSYLQTFTFTRSPYDT